MATATATAACLAAALLPPEFPPLGLLADLDQERERLFAAFAKAHDERVASERAAVEEGEADHPEDPLRVGNVMAREHAVVLAQRAEAETLDALSTFARRAALAEMRAARTELDRLRRAALSAPDDSAARVSRRLASPVHGYVSAALFPPECPPQSVQDNPDFDREDLLNAYANARAARDAAERTVEGAEAAVQAWTTEHTSPEGQRAAAVAEVLGYALPDAPVSLAQAHVRRIQALNAEATALSDVIAFAERVIGAELAVLSSQGGSLRDAAARSWVMNI